MAAPMNVYNNFCRFFVFSEVILDDSDDEFVGDDEDGAFVMFGAGLSASRRPYVPKITGFFENLVPQFTDEDFRYHFRVTRPAFSLMVNSFRPYILNDYLYIGGFDMITPEKQMAIFIWYAANQSSMRQVALKFDVSKGTVHKIVWGISAIMCEHSSKFIKWPDQERRRAISRTFGADLPGIVGVVDGTHIEISNPAGDDDSYFNRKGFASVQAQVVCDDMLLINDLYVGFPGSAHDARVFRNSPIYQIASGPNGGDIFNGDEYILADSAYPCKNYVIPIIKNHGRITRQQKNFNRLLSMKRQCVERCIGLWKGRMRKLLFLPFTDQTEDRAKLIKRIVQFIVATAVIHNCCILEHDDLEDYINHEAYERGHMGRPNDGRGQAAGDDRRRLELIRLVNR